MNDTIDRLLVLATHNPGKVKELAALMQPFGITVSSAAEHHVPEPEETGSSFAENATLKSEHTAQHTGLPALADDSGLAVEALGGAPGIYSARWAPGKDFTVAMQRIHDELEKAGHTPEGARAAFICALALTDEQGNSQTFEGRVEGRLTFPARGSKGFGYDPIFIPDGHTSTFAEMEPAAKHAISHRARAFAKLEMRLKEAA